MENNRNRGGSSLYDPQPHIPMYRATPHSQSQSSSFYPNIGQPGHSVIPPPARLPPFNTSSSPPSSLGPGIRVQIKPEFGITPPPQLIPQMGEIPRSSFQTDFSLERKILAEADKGNPNWSRFAAENLPSRMSEPTPSMSSVAPAVDPVVRKYITSGLNREAVPLAVENFGDNPAKAMSGLEWWQLMVAGSVAGCAEHVAMFPMDTIKTRMQVPSSSPICPIKSPLLSIRTAFRSIIKSDGPAGLYRGIGAMALGAGPSHAVSFSVYEFFKKNLPYDNLITHATSGACAAVMSDAVLTPMDMIKQRLQLSGGGAIYNGVWDCGKSVFKNEGFGAFYASYGTTVIMNAPAYAVYFATYEAAKKGLMHIAPPGHTLGDDTLLVHASAGAAAGALSAVVTTPLDVVKTLFQCQGVCGCERFKTGSISHVIKTIIEKDGYRGLMRGWIPRMIFHAPAAAICWSTYEFSKAFFLDLNLKNPLPDRAPCDLKE